MFPGYGFRSLKKGEKQKSNTNKKAEKEKECYEKSLRGNGGKDPIRTFIIGG